NDNEMRGYFYNINMIKDDKSASQKVQDIAQNLLTVKKRSTKTGNLVVWNRSTCLTSNKNVRNRSTAT
ncbi:8063_t:CDS:2, partial [Gigaspora rosea]